MPRPIDREQLLHLLAEAAEIEHNLLCCYLYAAFSLKRAPADGVEPHEAAAIESWRMSIMGIALEEMAHLAIVANITVALGARPHFNRPNMPVAPGYHPADIVVKLAPFDMDTLDHFIFLERPRGSSLADGSGFRPEVPYERSGHPGAALMPYAADYETVAEFYQTLREGMVSLAREIGEEALFRGGESRQVGPELIDIPGIVKITGLDSALAAIDTIIVQGEGSAAESADSHFARFRAIKDEYLRLLAARPGFAPAWPAAINPVMRRPLDSADDRTFVEAPSAAAVLDLSNALYNLLLRLLTQAYARATPDGQAARRLLELAMQAMRVFGMTAEHLATLPASDGNPEVHAGVTFAIMRAIEPLAEGASEWRLIEERIREIAQRMRAIGSGVPALDRARCAMDELEASASQKPG